MSIDDEVLLHDSLGQVHVPLDHAQRSRNSGQQIRIEPQWIPLPCRFNMHAHALLFGDGLVGCETRTGGGNTDLCRHVPEVKIGRFEVQII